MKPFFSILLLLVLLGLGYWYRSNKTKSNMNGIAHVDVSGAKEMIQNIENLVILDVRTPEETADGIIKGAIEIDVRNPDFAQKIDKLDRETPYLVYCRSGRRSVTACEIMRDMGFANTTNMKGGYLDWSE